MTVLFNQFLYAQNSERHICFFFKSTSLSYFALQELIAMSMGLPVGDTTLLFVRYYSLFITNNAKISLCAPLIPSENFQTSVMQCSSTTLMLNDPYYFIFLHISQFHITLLVICLLIYLEQRANKHSAVSPMSVASAFPYRVVSILYCINTVFIFFWFLNCLPQVS